MSFLKRINKDLLELKQHNIDIIQNEEDMRILTCKIFGPPDTEYEAGIFNLKIILSSNYPISPP